MISVQRVKEAVIEGSCLTISRFLTYYIWVPKVLTLAIAGKGDTIFGIKFDQAWFNEIDFLWEVSFPIDDIVFVNLHLPKLLDHGPYEVTVMTLIQEIDVLNQSAKSEVKYFFSESCW